MSGLALIGYLMIFSLMVIIITKKMSAFSANSTFCHVSTSFFKSSPNFYSGLDNYFILTDSFLKIKIKIVFIFEPEERY